MKEHYQLSLPSSTIQFIVKEHAKSMHDSQKTLDTQRVHRQDPKHIEAQIDGGMVPIVTIDRETKGDKRKTRKTGWRESRLSLAHEQGSVSPIYKATLGTINEAGDQLADVVALAGRGKKTRVHCVGDGAPWIADQVDQLFGSNGTYLIDFYHLCLYLAPAAECLSPHDKLAWLDKQKESMKDNQAESVLKELKNHMDNEQSDHVCNARKCYQYMEKRMHQFDYKYAIENDLPIGSGEIESGHRSVVQKRLKLPGGWWLEENAENMLAMRTVRANNNWSKYWNQYQNVEHSVGVTVN